MRYRIQALAKAPYIKTPFMWRSNGGCVYLRNRDNLDVIIGPVVPDDKLGAVCDQSQRVSLAEAWGRRLSCAEELILANDPV